ncbi:hypothetical protein [Campylobacter sp.]|uniref:hypothetical protein n=1 Tax=Campylobacter sp. TaxID=205 RepID=UPI002A6657CB|nr:hypothetical protein [Campylobacter sp.]MDD7703305.1 hypothetical protein [Campylobacteraceae bacterium]MDY2634828.1 hypothetical protein [Campylobacter sp.]
MLDFLFYIFQAIGSFFIILLFFYKAIFLFIISAFCWSLAIHNILLLNIKKKYKFFFVGLILAIIFGSGAYKQDYIFLVCAVIFTPIFLYLLRKKLHNFYIFKLQKSLIAFGLFGTMVCVWQLEVPQRIVFESLIEAKVILIDRDYVVLEDKNNFGRTDNIAEGKWESYDDLFGIIRFSKKDFYACDTIDCKGKKKKIGEIHSSSISESTLHCALKLGGGCGLINASKSDSYSLLEYLKQNQNKQINKQGENNVTK